MNINFLYNKKVYKENFKSFIPNIVFSKLNLKKYIKY